MENDMVVCEPRVLHAVGSAAPLLCRQATMTQNELISEKSRYDKG